MPKRTPKAKNQPAAKEQRQDFVTILREVADFIITEIKDFRREQRQKNQELDTKLEEVRKQGETNTQSLEMLTDEIHKAKNLEFDIYNHEQRITTLEKARQ